MTGVAEASFPYFAYGSNMLSTRLRERCPSAEALRPVVLKGWKLEWHKPSKDGSSKCTIVQSTDPNAEVFGILYLIDPSDIDNLRRAEGVGGGYEEIQVEISNEPLQVNTYRATKADQSRKPYTWYRALVVAGAREHGLSDAYVAELEAISAIEDPDRNRHEENMCLITGEEK